jgi:hypothetical protein
MSRPVRSVLLAALAALLLALPVAARAGLYEWTDEDGRTHYSNEPRPGARPVGVKPIALADEGAEDDSQTDALRRDRLNRQRADRRMDTDGPTVAPGMAEAPAEAHRPPQLPAAPRSPGEPAVPAVPPALLGGD